MALSRRILTPIRMTYQTYATNHRRTQMNFKKWKDRVCLLEMQVMELKGVMDKSRLTHRHTKAVFDTDNEYYGNPWNFVKRPNISGDRYWHSFG